MKLQFPLENIPSLHFYKKKKTYITPREKGLYIV